MQLWAECNKGRPNGNYVHRRA